MLLNLVVWEEEEEKKKKIIARQHTFSKVLAEPCPKLFKDQTDIIRADRLALFRRGELKMVLEVSQRLVSPDVGSFIVRGERVLVGIDDVVPNKQANSKQHGSVEVIPLSIRPPPIYPLSVYSCCSCCSCSCYCCCCCCCC